MAGAISGLLTSVLWDGVAKPRRERRFLASALATELEVALYYLLVLHHVVQSRSSVPPEFHAPTEVFNNLVGRLGELPRELRHAVVSTYRQIAELNWVAERHLGTTDVRAFRGQLEAIHRNAAHLVVTLEALADGRTRSSDSAESQAASEGLLKELADSVASRMSVPEDDERLAAGDNPSPEVS